MNRPVETLVLNRLLDPVSLCLTPESALKLVELRSAPELQERIDLLAEKNTEGQLTTEEREEYETLVRAGLFIAILQAKARKLLAKQDDMPSPPSPSVSWLDRIFGTFANDPIYEEAMRLGREYREAQHEELITDDPP